MFEKLSAKMLQCANGCADPFSCDYFDAGELKCMRQLLFEGAAAIRTLESKERPAYLPQYELVPRKTHYDLLIRMTPEELAWEICRICRMPFYKDDSEIDEYEVDCWAKWLKQEAKE